MGSFPSYLCLVGVCTALSTSGRVSEPNLEAPQAQIREIVSMGTARANHTATPLPNGKVLVAGGFAGSGDYRPYASTEIYDPGSRRFIRGPAMSVGRSAHTATLLANGKILITGGATDAALVQPTAELYDVRSNRFEPAGRMSVSRAGHTATLLPNGQVLITGGRDGHGQTLNTAELYDPISGSFRPAGPMRQGRLGHTATLLKSGKVLIVGGGQGVYPRQTIFRTAELYDPATRSFEPSGSMAIARHKHGAAMLADGRVLIVGGSDARDWSGQINSAEIYDPVKNTFAVVGSMAQSRFKIPDAVVPTVGGALVVGGGATAEIYNVRSRDFHSLSSGLGEARFFTAATPLPGGQVLITGGYAEQGGELPATAKAWLFIPNSAGRPSPGRKSVVASSLTIAISPKAHLPQQKPESALRAS